MNKRSRKTVLFINGDLPEPENLLTQLSSNDFLIAVDGGLNHMTRLNLTPDLIIGDLDSTNNEIIQQFRSDGVEVRKFPTEKDETDLEIALEAALEMKSASIWVVAALGKRIDQTLGNIFLLTRSDLASYDICLVDGLRELFLIRDSRTIIGKPGQRVSLLPLNGPAEGIRTEGLHYTLQDETLFPDKTRGISNLMAAPTAKVSVQRGLLLCIHETIDTTKRSD